MEAAVTCRQFAKMEGRSWWHVFALFVVVRQNLGHTADATNSIRARAKTDSRGHTDWRRPVLSFIIVKAPVACLVRPPPKAKGEGRRRRKGRRENGLRTIAEMALQQGIDLSTLDRFGVPWLFKIISCKFSTAKSSVQRFEVLNLKLNLQD